MYTARCVVAAVYGKQQKLCKITACPEELHLLADLHCRNTAGNSIIVSVNGTHNIVIFILYGVCVNGNLGTVALEALGKRI